MQIFLLIARRYLYTAKKRKIIHFVGLIAWISMSISTTAIILSTGVYNGLESLILEMIKSIDSDIKIGSKAGKKFKEEQEIITTLKKLQGISSISAILEDYVIVTNGENVSLAYLQGSKNYGIQKKNISKFTLNKIDNCNQTEKTLTRIGAGLANALSIKYIGQSIMVMYPKKTTRKKFNLIEKPYNIKFVNIEGIFSIDKQQDEKYILTSLLFAQILMEANNTITSINIDLVPGANLSYIKAEIIKTLNNNDFYVKTIDEEQKTLIQAIKLEKICTKVVFFAIMLIAAMNIFFTLSMLILIKRKDLYILYILGATKKTIYKIFLTTGMIIALRGIVIGSFFAYTLGLIQQKYGLISLGAIIGDTDSYPIKMHFLDFAHIWLITIFITLLASWVPLTICLKQWTKRLDTQMK